MIALPKESKDRSRASIKRYFLENLELDIGDLKAELVLDFFLKEIAPSIYNRAIHDARTYVEHKVADLDGTCYEAEFGYWRR